MEYSLGLQISILLFTAMLGFLLAVRFGQSVVIWEILLGVILGPSLLGIVHYEGLVKILAEIGMIMLLFVVGLECKFKEVYTKENFWIAALGVLFPFFGGLLLALLFHYNFVQSLFIGTALTATSIAITVSALKEMGRIDERFAKAIIGAAIIDDVLSLFVLSITISAATQNISTIMVIGKIVLAVIFFIAASYFGQFLTKTTNKIQIMALRHQRPELTMIFAMTIAFAYSAVAELIGLSAIVGAFIAGISLEQVSYGAKYKEGAQYFQMVFSAIFFVSLGVLVNVKEAGTGILSIFFLALLAVAFLSKAIAGYLAAKWFSFREKESWAIGIGMVPRGEVAMIIALYGISHGIITQSIYGIIIVMVLLTTTIAPIMLYQLLNKPGKQRGRDSKTRVPKLDAFLKTKQKAEKIKK